MSGRSFPARVRHRRWAPSRRRRRRQRPRPGRRRRRAAARTSRAPGASPTACRNAAGRRRAGAHCARACASWASGVAPLLRPSCGEALAPSSHAPCRYLDTPSCNSTWVLTCRSLEEHVGDAAPPPTPPTESRSSLRQGESGAQRAAARLQEPSCVAAAPALEWPEPAPRAHLAADLREPPGLERRATCPRRSVRSRCDECAWALACRNSCMYV